MGKNSADLKCIEIVHVFIRNSTILVGHTFGKIRDFVVQAFRVPYQR